MTPLVTLLIALFADAATVPAVPVTACTTVAGERITAGDLARTLPAFTSVAPDTPIGYSPVPGARRLYRIVELERLAARYRVTLEPAREICFERVMEMLTPERVADAMKHGLGDLEARIEVVEMSRYPVPPGEIHFTRATLPIGADTPVIWRGFVRYGGERRFAIWARVRIQVRSKRIIATENVAAGSRIDARQVRVEERDAFPSVQPENISLDGITGKISRRAIPAGSAVSASLLEEPKDVERGEMVQVEVHSGAARLKLEGRAQTAGRMGEAVRIRNLSTGKSFSANVSAKGRVVLSAATAPAAKDGN